MQDKTESSVMILFFFFGGRILNDVDGCETSKMHVNHRGISMCFSLSDVRILVLVVLAFFLGEGQT